MKLPEIVRQVGEVDGSRVVFVEDYVLQYLELCKERVVQGEGRIVLYGEMKEKEGECVCVVYGAGEAVEDEELLGGGMPKDDEEWSDRMPEGGMPKDDEEWSDRMPEGGDNWGSGAPEGAERFVTVGYVDMGKWRGGGDDCSGIYLKYSGGQAVRGYYVFYDKNEGMKECLGRCYIEGRGKKREEKEARDRKKEEGGEGTKLPELVAMSCRQEREALSPYVGIRMIVIGILIIFCAIAVTTIDNYDKLNDFVQTAVHAGKILEEP